MYTQDEFFTPQQLAKMGRVSYATVLNHIKAGKLDALALGGNYAIRREDALRWIEIGGEEISQENLELLERRVIAIRTALAALQQGAK